MPDRIPQNWIPFFEQDKQLKVVIKREKNQPICVWLDNIVGNNVPTSYSSV